MAQQSPASFPSTDLATRRDRIVRPDPRQHRVLEQRPQRRNPAVLRRRRRLDSTEPNNLPGRRRMPPAEIVEHVGRAHPGQRQARLNAKPQEAQQVVGVRTPRCQGEVAVNQMSQKPVDQLDIAARPDHPVTVGVRLDPKLHRRSSPNTPSRPSSTRAASNSGTL